jgi:hypothetical protein
MPFADPEKRKEYIKKHYIKNKEKYKEKARQWEVDNPEKIKLRGQTRYPKNPEKENARVNEWIKKNPDRYKRNTREYAAKWRGNNPEKFRFTSYKAAAKRRGIEFSLTRDEFISYWGKPCSYCGDSVDKIGLDRIDSDRGYFVDNVVPCCILCNWVKMRRSAIDFISHCRRVAEHSSVAGILSCQ